jgi:hypothetical protein
MGNIIALPYAVAAKCGLVDHLHGDTGHNICIGTSGIPFDQIPTAQAQVFRGQKP